MAESWHLYPWCETLADDCDCHGAKGGLGDAYCSDFGFHDETDKRARKSRNVKYLTVFWRMEVVVEGGLGLRMQRETGDSGPGLDAVPAK